MGIWRLRMEPGLVPERPFTLSRARSGASARSMVDADICSSLVRTSGESVSSPKRSRASTASLMNGARRLPAGPFMVAHTTTRASTTSGP